VSDPGERKYSLSLRARETAGKRGKYFQVAVTFRWLKNVSDSNSQFKQSEHNTKLKV